MTQLNITQEQYEADIRAAKAGTWGEGWNDGVVDQSCGCTDQASATPNPYQGGAK